MKVLQINSVCGIGSTGRIATDIHLILKNKGYESWIAYGREEARNCENTIRIGSKNDNYKHLLKTRIFDRHGFGSKKATELFIENVEKINPDIIHLHNIHGYFLNIEILFSYLKKKNKPVVWTLHDCWAFTGHCSYFDYVSCNKWESECFNCPEKKEYPASLIKDNSTENFYDKKEIFNGVKNLQIITPSRWLADLVKRSFLASYPVEVINNGIDLSVFKPINSSFKEKYVLEDKKVILGVANVWDRRKGMNFFISLAKEIDENERIVLVGLNDKQLENLPTNIIGIKKTKNIDELVEIYNSADVFVNPTLEDNFPTTNLEALACGTPVVTFDTGGSVESIDETCGRVVKKGSIKGLVQAINEAYSLERNTCRAMAMNYDKTKKFEKYIEIYKTLTK